MSRRTAEANKAIAEAWKRERQLVINGKGTRDWTQKQQNDIVEKGKAYDDDGKAFEGHHMKNVANYPTLQGNPNNIQFLTRTEHLEAHGGSYQNPTNGYYDPLKKETMQFNGDDLIPCKVTELSEPIKLSNNEITDYENNDIESSDKSNDKHLNSAPLKSQKIDETYLDQSIESTEVKNSKKGRIKPFLNLVKEKLPNLLYKGIEFTFSNVIPTILSNALVNKYNPSNDIYNISSINNTESINNQKQVVKTPPKPHQVKGHKQSYNTKNGKIIKDIAPYYRGGKNDGSSL